MFNPSRDQVRSFFFETWRKYRAGEPLESLEATALAIILEHPEYHALLADPAGHASREWSPEAGLTNPFLHLSMHLALEEQWSIDQPPGIRALFDELTARFGGAHDAAHAAMDCLGEVVWRAERLGTLPDGQAYLECLRRRAAA